MLIYPLVILAITDDEDRAFMERLYRDLHGLMYARAFMYVHNGHDADDVVNDCCVALIGKISVLRELPCNSLRAYVVTTVKNIAINRTKSAWKRRESEQDNDALDAIPSSENQPEETFFRKELIESLLDCVDRLSERDQALLRMRYYLDMSDGEIGRVLGIKPDTVRPCLSRVRNRIRKMMQEDADDGRS